MSDPDKKKNADKVPAEQLLTSFSELSTEVRGKFCVISGDVSGSSLLAVGLLCMTEEVIGDYWILCFCIVALIKKKRRAFCLFG